MDAQYGGPEFEFCPFSPAWPGAFPRASASRKRRPFFRGPCPARGVPEKRPAPSGKRQGRRSLRCFSSTILSTVSLRRRALISTSLSLPGAPKNGKTRTEHSRYNPLKRTYVMVEGRLVLAEASRGGKRAAAVPNDGRDTTAFGRRLAQEAQSHLRGETNLAIPQARAPLRASLHAREPRQGHGEHRTDS